MTLEVLNKEMITAWKAKDMLRKETISSLIGNIKKAAIDEKCRNDIPEELIGKVLLKEQKTMQEMIDTCPADRIETLDEYKKKMEIIKEFAPQLITDEEEIKKKIYDILSDIELQNTNNKNVIKIVMQQLKGKVDMKIANKTLGEILNKIGDL